MIFCSSINLRLNVGHLLLFYFLHIYHKYEILTFFDQFFINRNYISLIAK